MEKKQSMLKLLRENKQFRNLWIGQLISQTGDSINWMANLAFVTIIAPVIGTSILMLWMTVPIILFGPVAGVIVDRFSRKNMMLFADFTRALSIGLFIIALVNFISVKSDIYRIEYENFKIKNTIKKLEESISNSEKKLSKERLTYELTNIDGNAADSMKQGEYIITATKTTNEDEINIIVSTSISDYEKIVLKRVEKTDKFSGKISLNESKKSYTKNGKVEMGAKEGYVEISHLEKNGWIFLVYIVAFVVSLITQVYIPAKSALVPEVVEEDELVFANSISASTHKIVMVFGSALGGFIVARFGIINALILDVLTYVISFITILFIKERHFHEVLNNREKDDKNFVGEMKEGIRYMLKNSIVRFSCTRYITIMASAGITYIFMINYSNETLRMGIEGVGYLTASLGIGIILGSMSVGFYGNKLSKITMVKLGYVIVAFALLGFAFNSSIFMAVLLGIVGGYGAGLIIVLSETILQVTVPVDIRGRIFAVLQTLTNASLNIFAILSGIILVGINEKHVFLTLGGLMLSFAVLSEIHSLIRKDKINGGSAK